MNRLTTAQVDVEDFALVTHAVPAERVRRHVPEMFELETFVSEDGVETALIATACFCNRQLHWSMSRHPAHDFGQMTFRTFVSYRGRAAAYFFGTYVDTRLSFVGQSMITSESFLVPLELDARRGPAGYPSYRCNATTDHGEVGWELEATVRPVAKHPFATADELVDFVSYRLHGLSRNPLGFQTYGPVDHRRLKPWAGTLRRGRFDFWERMDILAGAEFEDVYSILVEPSVRFILRPPRPAF